MAAIQKILDKMVDGCAELSDNSFNRVFAGKSPFQQVPSAAISNLYAAIGVKQTCKHCELSTRTPGFPQPTRWKMGALRFP